MKRKIVSIDEEKCNGCGLCVNACHEGAIQLIDGKAKLISDKYCDGLGDCLPACPQEAIKIIEREAEEYSEEAVKALKAQKEAQGAGKQHHGCPGTMARQIEKPQAQKAEGKLSCGCPGTMAKRIEKHNAEQVKPVEVKNDVGEAARPSELSQWPVQLKLVNPGADYLKGADLLIAADCTAYAYGDFHRDFIKGRVVLVGCPKLDDNEYYREKLTSIFKNNDIKSITVVRMEVPCCSGIVKAVREAMLDARTIVPYQEFTIGIDGSIVA